jgi:hypothetical protein
MLSPLVICAFSWLAMFFLMKLTIAYLDLGGLLFVNLVAWFVLHNLGWLSLLSFHVLLHCSL